jgi:NTE family protein
MNATPSQARRRRGAPAPRTVSLALSGGNALGAYAGGAIEALEQAGIRFDVLSGASIGAVSAAIVAGNPPGRAGDALRAFWAVASSGPGGAWPGLSSGRARELVNGGHALRTVLFGRPGLFSPRPTGFLSLLPGMPPDVALFDSRPIAATLERLVDFDRLNDARSPRLVVAAVDVESGEAVYFDSRRDRITPRHLLASTGFLPSFPPVDIDGRLLGDPGLLCNLPLDPILIGETGDRLCFLVDLYSGEGPRPRSLDTSLERAQDIVFSAQTSRTLQAFRREQRLRHLLERAPRTAARDRLPPPGQVDIVIAAYRALPHELAAKALEYSAASLGERWDAGRRDMEAGLDALSGGRPDIGDLGFSLYRGQASAAATAPSGPVS